MKRKLFCEISPACYEISLRKEVVKRKVKNLISPEKIAKNKTNEELPNIIKSHRSVIVRKLYGVDEKLQQNKVTNIELAAQKINGLIIKPNEVFSYWETVGKTSLKKGYKEGLLIKNNGSFGKGAGGGLCQMANMIHYLVLNSPLQVTELHHHSDALFPDERRTVPFGTGTSILYNNLDYRFKNTANQDFQILVWISDGDLCGELRSEYEIPYRYKLVEEDHHYKKEGNDYYRISKVYRIIIDKSTNEEIAKELILDNHSIVMYNHNLIPKDEIR